MSAPSSPARLRGLGLIALAALSWGTTGSVTAVLVERAAATPLVIGTVRMAVAAVALLATARVLGRLRLARGDGWRCVALGVCMAAFQATYFTAVTRAGIAVTALLAICSAPIMIAVLAAALLGERPGRRLAAALAAGVAGTALLVAAPSEGAVAAPRAASGVVLALAAGLAYALYVVIAKRAVASSPPLPLAAATFAAAAVIMAPALATEGAAQQIARGWPWLLYLGVVATAGAYALYTTGLRDVSASAAGVASLLEPLTATLLGVLLFGERLGPVGTAGAVLLLAALALLAAPER
ncbi:MAG TPA: EamA family transporter [Methylomirabilota bacterium]|jgi:DME family drug/metabolite transporter|nr:EamA family transporter [Methylomirabilota bacterium]